MKRKAVRREQTKATTIMENVLRPGKKAMESATPSWAPLTETGCRWRDKLILADLLKDKA